MRMAHRICDGMESKNRILQDMDVYVGKRHSSIAIGALPILRRAHGALQNVHTDDADGLVVHVAVLSQRPQTRRPLLRGTVDDPEE